MEGPSRGSFPLRPFPDSAVPLLDSSSRRAVNCSSPDWRAIVAGVLLGIAGVVRWVWEVLT
jgi:hypothetical protein